jgi:AMP-polyphosphate phosphotransferase
LDGEVPNPLDAVDLTLSLSAKESLERVSVAQRRLAHLSLVAAGLLEQESAGPGIVVIFEGFDAAGKGGAIRRITWALDPRHVRVVPVGPPTKIELSHHFLWRFQGSLPSRGAMTIYDRSWYGRVLVERVEHLIDPKSINRSMTEIVEFERSLVLDETVIVKFWLHTSDAEQLKRFVERRDDPLKQWKLTPDDWRNRDKRTAYVDAANEMVERTDHEHARWHVVAAENKHFARAFVLESLNKAIEHAFERRGLVVRETRGDDYLEDAVS